MLDTDEIQTYSTKQSLLIERLDKMITIRYCLKMQREPLTFDLNFMILYLSAISLNSWYTSIMVTGVSVSALVLRFTL